jgi:uncharacterized protein YeaO (DUF488 family)
MTGMAAAPAVSVARIYHLPPDHDGSRVLVDRLWPRGLRKDDAPMDLWCKEVAPSNRLRHWYGHDAALFDEFSARYQAELADPARAAALDRLRELSLQGPLTLLTATKTPEISHAEVLARLLREHRDRPVLSFNGR